MSPKLIKLNKKVESFREVLKENGFEDLHFFWYNDGQYNAMWKNMSVACEEPDNKEHTAYWQFGFKSQNNKIKRIHLEALMPVFEDYFRFELRYYPETKLHDKKGIMGPTPVLYVSGIMEEDLINLQNYIEYLLHLEK